MDPNDALPRCTARDPRNHAPLQFGGPRPARHRRCELRALRRSSAGLTMRRRGGTLARVHFVDAALPHQGFGQRAGASWPHAHPALEARRLERPAHRGRGLAGVSSKIWAWLLHAEFRQRQSPARPSPLIRRSPPSQRPYRTSSVAADSEARRTQAGRRARTPRPSRLRAWPCRRSGSWTCCHKPRSPCDSCRTRSGSASRLADLFAAASSWASDRSRRASGHTAEEAAGGARWGALACRCRRSGMSPCYRRRCCRCGSCRTNSGNASRRVSGPAPTHPCHHCKHHGSGSRCRLESRPH